MAFVPLIGLFILGILLFILLAIKSEDHFRYFKILFPDRLNKYGSYISSWNNLSLDIFGIRYTCILPYFAGRRIDLEKDNKQLKKLADKIQKNCIRIFVIGILFVLLSIIHFIIVFR